MTMNKFNLISSIALYCGCIGLSASPFLDLATGQDVTDLAGKQVARTVSQTESGIIVSYNIPYANVVTDTVFPDSKLLDIDNFGNISRAGYPALPVRTDEFVVPDGCESVAIELLSASSSCFQMKVAPARPSPVITTDGHSDSVSVLPIAHNLDMQNVPFISPSNIERYKNRSLINVSLYPMRYNIIDENVEFSYSFSYKLTYLDSNGSPIVVEKVAENPAKRISIPILTNKAEDELFLIITTPEYAQEISMFTNWKKMQGYQVAVSQSDSWTSQSMSDSISHYFDKQNLTYAMIVGNHQQVPGELINSAASLGSPYDLYSDHHYAMVTNKSAYLRYDDFFIGRLCVDNVSELKSVIEKIVNHERDPVTDDYFYQTGVHIATFGAENTNPNREYCRFLESSERIRDYMLSQGKYIQRIYSKPSKSQPTYWSDGTVIPQELLASINWNGSQSDIKSAINDGCSYVLYQSHGSPEGWTMPSINFNTGVVRTFYNGKYLPMVFSMTCFSGAFYLDDCFASAFLKAKGGGCAGIIAAAHKIYSYDNDLLTHGMFNIMYPDPGFPGFLNQDFYTSEFAENTIGTLGEIVQGGLHYVKAHNEVVDAYGSSKYSNFNNIRMRYHIFGDPSMIVHTETPTKYSDEEVWVSRIVMQRNPDSPSMVTPIFNVSLEDEEAIVGVYNPNTGQSSRYRGSNMEIRLSPRPYRLEDNDKFHYFPMKDEYVYVYGKNRIPKMLYGPEMSPWGQSVEIFKYSMTITPNPASANAVITINGTRFDKEYTLRIYDWNSNLVKTIWTTPDECPVVLDVSGMQDGRYIINLIVGMNRVAAEQMIISK